MNTALKQNWTPTISKEMFESGYMTLEESSAKIDELIDNHFHHMDSTSSPTKS